MKYLRPLQSSDIIRHRYLISYWRWAVLFYYLPASVACSMLSCRQLGTGDTISKCCLLPATRGSSFCKWLLCILRKISNDFHLSMQIWVFREFPSLRVYLFFFFSHFLVMCPKFKMTEIAYHWQINKSIVGHIVYLIFANCVQQRIQCPSKNPKPLPQVQLYINHLTIVTFFLYEAVSYLFLHSTMNLAWYYMS